MANYLQKMSISQIIVFVYLSVILIGTGLLMLPVSSTQGEWTSFLTALYTSTSAISVTGQVVVNTSTYWSYIGTTIILILMEIGGLGFMSIWVLFYYFIAGHRPNLKQRRVVSESLALDYETSIQQRVWQIIAFSLVVQAVGAVLLSIPFIRDYGVFAGMYHALFHSVSAFTSGGFDLFGDSLIFYQASPFVLLVISALTMTGGLGFIVWDDLLKFPKKRKLKVYTKIVLTTTVSLWLMATVLFWYLEFKAGTFSHLTPFEQLVNSFFLAISPRSIGMSTVDYSTLSTGSIFLTNILMFIGASSGSTGGGIKVSTLAVIIIVAYNFLYNRKPMVFNREISAATIKRSFFIFTAGIVLLTIGTFALLITETIPEHLGIEYIMTEVISTLGTVGITLGLSSHLTIWGKIISIILMLVGRVGVLTFLWSLTGEQRETRITYPDLDMLIG